MYRYETHCHISTTSACSRLSAEDAVELYTRNGYAGVFITDHFLNGNTTVDRTLSYREQIHAFCEGYRAVKECAKDRLQVFFGLEFSDCGTDVLLYGWDEEALMHEEAILKMDLSALCRYCAERGVLTVHAHPFRDAERADGFRMVREAEGVEVMNSARSALSNALAQTYAAGCGKLMTGGSDCHAKGQPVLSGMEFETRLSSERDFAACIRRGEGKIFTVPNALA